MGTPIAYAHKLARQATRAAESRGHVLGTWDWTDRAHGGRRTGIAACVDCGRMAFVDTHPAPNGIDISGEAVALGCTSEAAQ